MLKKSLLSLAVTASLVGLAGCDISSTTANAGNTPELQEQQAAALAAYGTYPIFDPVNSKLPLGTDLIFADAGDSDGTANVGADGGNPVYNAINDLDGGISTLASIDIPLSGSVDPDTVTAGAATNPTGTVWLVRLPNAADVAALDFPDVGGGFQIDTDENDDPVYLNASNYDALDASHAGALLTEALYTDVNDYNAAAGVFAGNQPAAGDFEVSVISLDGGTDNTVRISPTAPLDGKTKYIVVLTDGILDTDGDALKPSPDYAVIKAGDASKYASSSLVAVNSAITGWESLAAGYVSAVTGGAVTTADFVISSAFTTVDPTTVLGAMAAPVAALPAALNPGNAISDAIEPQAREFEFIPAGQISIKTLTYDADEDESSIPLDVNISQGAIKLPQYVDAFATDANDTWEPLVTAATPEDTDGTTNVTYRFPFAAEKRDAVVPVLMFEPIGSGTSAACSKPVAGWPVVIMQHGFTTNRTGNLINGANVANFTCHAVISIDLPHHGVAADAGAQLAFNVEQSDGLGAETNTPWATAVDGVIAATADTPEATMLDELAERHEGFYLDSTSGSVLPMDFDNAAGGSGSLFIRLDNFQRTRDNMRQGVMDLLNLSASIANIDIDGDDTVPDLDVANVQYIGHSLGAIIGTPFVAMNNYSKATGGNANLSMMQSAVLATPGGHMTKLIENSAALSTSVLAGLEGADASLVQGNSALESFMKVFQATLDSADPMNFVSTLQAVNANFGTPILLLGMYGNGTTNPSDLVVPITGEGTVLASGATKAPTAESPLVGLEPMLDILGAENVTGTPVGDIYIAKYNEGGHGTFSSAGSSTDESSYDSAAAYAEMRAQIVDLLDDGALTAAKAATVLIAD